jgi:hypothetical protein
MAEEGSMLSARRGGRAIYAVFGIGIETGHYH